MPRDLINLNCLADKAEMKELSAPEKRKPKTEGPIYLPTHLALWLIRAYQLMVSPLIPHCCRFAPTCSHYAAESFRRHGFIRGLGLTLRRLGRCHPFHPGGWDPVP
jgi:putative membrane protein insertion efficiency factor